MRFPIAQALGLALSATCLPALAVQSCELNGQPVNPTNGNTTQDKSGLMRCHDGEGGPVVREQELKGGVFKVVVRYFKDGRLKREYRVKERGNRGGLAREWARGDNGAKPVLAREETYRDGDGRPLRQQTAFHDNGKKSFEGSWRLAISGGRSSELATDGHLRAERFYDERGRITRERSFDVGGSLVRNDEVFEDGSRKEFGR